eukprot:542492_1
MTTLNTLTMHNNNLSKLLSDKRICSNSKLVSMVIISLQTLDSTKQIKYKQIQSSNKNNKKQQTKNDNIIPEIEEKLTDINKLEDRLKNMETKYIKHKKSKFEYLQKSKRKYINDLNNSKNQITHTFSTIFQVLKQKEHLLLSELEKYNVEELHSININQSNDDSKDDEKKSSSFHNLKCNFYNNKSDDNIDNIFNEKYKANELIISDCKRYINEQLNVLKVFMENADNIDNCSAKMKIICNNIHNMYSGQLKRFQENEKYMKQQTIYLEKNKYNLNSVNFKLNEKIFTNIIGEIDIIGEILRYKKLEIEIKKIEWTDIDHINIYYEFMNISSENITNINIQQYEICYRYFDINMPDIDDKFEWKTLLFPSRTISNNKMVAINPISIQIERIKDANDIRYITSDNETLFFIKLRMKHNPYYLWSNYSSTYKRKASNFLLIEKNKQIALKLTQKKKKKSKGYRRKSYASTHSSNSPKFNNSLGMIATNSLNNHNSYRRQSSTDLSDSTSHGSGFNSSYYHQYYTFDTVIINQNGILTIQTINDANDQDNNSDESTHPKGYLHIVIHRDLIIHKGGCINVSGLGYSGGTRYESGDSVNTFGELGQTSHNKGGGGGSKTYELGCGGGGGYGASGNNGCSGKGFGFSMNSKTKYRQGIDGEGGCSYGDNMLSVCYFGSGGGGGDYGDSKGGNGGGIVIIDCKGKIIMHENSAIKANGGNGKYDSDGCGSGGTIFIKCKYLSMKSTAKIEAIGGKNNLKGNGGNGGYGRIKIKCDDKNIPFNKYNISPRPYIG